MSWFKPRWERLAKRARSRFEAGRWGEAMAEARAALQAAPADLAEAERSALDELAERARRARFDELLAELRALDPSSGRAAELTDRAQRLARDRAERIEADAAGRVPPVPAGKLFAALAGAAPRYVFPPDESVRLVAVDGADQALVDRARALGWHIDAVVLAGAVADAATVAGERRPDNAPRFFGLEASGIDRVVELVDASLEPTRFPRIGGDPEQHVIATRDILRASNRAHVASAAAWHGDVPVAWIAGYPSDVSGEWLVDVVVAEAYRGRGFAWAAYDWLSFELLRRGGRTLVGYFGHHAAAVHCALAMRRTVREVVFAPGRAPRDDLAAVVTTEPS